MRDAILEALPRWRGNGDVIGVVNTPVRPCINLLRVIRVNNDRIHRNIREIPGLIRPGERAAVGGARHLENMTRSRRRVCVKSAYRCVPTGRFAADTVGSSAIPRTGRKGSNCVIAGNIYPVGL